MEWAVSWDDDNFIEPRHCAGCGQIDCFSKEEIE